MKVIRRRYSAQYGHTSGGFIEYTGKSGTNAYHGSVYDYFANDTLNANGLLREAVGQDAALSNNNFGATFGGPVVLPKLRRPQQDVLLHQLSTTRGCAPACCRASATRRPSTRSRTATSARC